MAAGGRGGQRGLAHTSDGYDARASQRFEAGPVDMSIEQAAASSSQDADTTMLNTKRLRRMRHGEVCPAVL